MKKLLLAPVIILLLISCKNEKEAQERELKKLQKEAQEFMKNQIDFYVNASPKYFSAKTIDGKVFNSRDLKNKNFVIFIYDISYLKKSETFDMPKEFNEIYNLYKDKIKFVGIIEGYVENEKELNNYLKNSNILFEQIDNTKSQNKPEILNYNMYCSPAKILINSSGKVIHSSCGGGNSNELMQKLDSLKKITNN